MTQKQALDILKMGKNVFLTGPAGSGKTYVLNKYISYLKSNGINVGITASTGIAATHMGGTTIHSWSGMGIKSELSEHDLIKIEDRLYLRKRFENVKALVIDEVSMLHHFRLDLLNRIAKRLKRSDNPFGGIQVVLCGDFFQLPPVSRFDEPQSKFAYESESWQDANFTVCYLEEQHRQKDPVSITLLNEIRAGEVSEVSRERLASRYNLKHKPKIEPTRLFTHNIDVDELNERELENIEAPMVEYEMISRGTSTLVDILKKSCLAPQTLRLKVGSKVMCLKNNFDAGYVNGTLGVVVSCASNTSPVIRTSDGTQLTIERTNWVIEEDGTVKAEISQYPLRLAWAMTVHKSQGMSIDAIEVDLSKSFESGMGYVALSRVRTFDGLSVIGINEKVFAVHPEVFSYDKELKKISHEAVAALKHQEKDEIKKIQQIFLERSKPEIKEQKIPSYEKTALLAEQKYSLAQMAKERGVTEDTILEHLEEFKNSELSVDIGYLKKEISNTHFIKLKKAIEEVAEENDEVRLTPVKNKVGANISYKHIRLARLLLGY
jgi:ATP-dependent DNA helicase PIF1